MRALFLAVAVALAGCPGALPECAEEIRASGCTAIQVPCLDRTDPTLRCWDTTCAGAVAWCRVDAECLYLKSNPEIWQCQHPGLEETPR